ncbi:hypothetical protein NOCARDAX2BIS_220160 [Nocardioides sp. AX2bis]|nr:hypothetical protein NOCARDAX2BIS_220160 [Nocardioides sp. AX2bis]
MASRSSASQLVAPLATRSQTVTARSAESRGAMPWNEYPVCSAMLWTADTSVGDKPPGPWGAGFGVGVGVGDGFAAAFSRPAFCLRGLDCGSSFGEASLLGFEYDDDDESLGKSAHPATTTPSVQVSATSPRRMPRRLRATEVRLRQIGSSYERNPAGSIRTGRVVRCLQLPETVGYSPPGVAVVAVRSCGWRPDRAKNVGVVELIETSCHAQKRRVHRIALLCVPSAP